MPRLVTVKKAETERQQAVHYVRNSLVYPSALIGLVSLVLGYGGVIYLFFTDRSTTDLLTYSLVLLGAGLALGLGQGLYQNYIFRSHPAVYADRVRRTQLRMSGRYKKIGDPVRAEHSGRWAAPYGYFLAWAGLIYLVFLSAPRLNYFSAIFLVLAGFHNARFFFLKRLVKK